jgi:exodeoxyribonuclease-3
MAMRIVSWNVNGIRACLDKGLERVIRDMDADFFCLQESKAHPDQVPLLPYPTLVNQASTWSSAEKKGYSGTVIFTPFRDTDLRAGMGIAHYDAEGRATLAFGAGFTVVNLYFPNGAMSPERHQFKMRFLEELLPWLKKLEAERGPIILCGDYNVAHKDVDVYDPRGLSGTSGFLPEERAWMTKLLDAGFVDTFRHVHGEKADQYTWWSMQERGRERNEGWRIDYICVSRALESKIRGAAIHAGIMGSDHCPVSVELFL